MFFQNVYINLAFILAILKFDWSEQLVLGSRGMAGLAWSVISISGTFWAIHACLAAASPGWLRELTGMRSLATDSAVGMDLELDLKVCRKLRTNMNEALGISSSANPRGGDPPTWKDIYAFDSSTSSFIRSVSEEEGKETNIRVCSGTKSPPKKMDSFQKTMLLMSVLCKAAEILTLHFMDAGLVCLTTALPWGAFVLGGLYLSNQSSLNEDTHDIIAGRLPTSISAGGPSKIVLNINKPMKHSLSWRIFWILGCIVSAFSYTLTLYLLSFQPSESTLCWLVFRLVDYYGCDLVYKEGDPVNPDILDFSSYTLHSLPHHLKPRILQLILATSRYQSLVHVRRTESYADDYFSEERIISMVKLPDLLQCYPIDKTSTSSNNAFVEINVVGVIGDTLLSSVAWITGLEFTPMDLYDCCIVSFKISKLLNTPAINVPCARVLSTPVKPKEDHTPQIVPKGTPNMGIDTGTEWIYFIPFTDQTYLVFRRPMQFSCEGSHRAQIMSNEQITDMLLMGTLNISLTHVDQVRETIALCRSVYMSLVKMV